MKKDRLYIWCDQIWLHLLYAIGIIMSCLLVTRWSAISTPTKLMYLLTIMIPMHVFEENSWPGGFYFQNNLGFKSASPMVYPQNMLTNMITNLGAEIWFIIWLILADKCPNSVVTAVVLFGYAECIHHTKDGICMRKRYAGKGKRTLYGPGTATSFIGLIQLSTYSLAWLIRQNPAPGEILAGIGILAFVILGLILIPLKISEKIKSQRFAFRSKGYYEKYE